MRIDLPEPDLLWTRWALFASALAALGYDDVYWHAADGAHHDDHGGNWSRLVRVDGGRAVLFGYDHEYSRTTGATPPIDLLATAPAWLPWPELLRQDAKDELGYVYWYDRGWSRVPYPDGTADGLTATLPALLDPARVELELLDVVTEWGEHDLTDPAERADVVAAAARLRAAAEARALDTAALTGLLGRLRTRPVDLAAGLAVATAAGIVAGSALPAVPAHPEVPPRRVRSLSVRQHEELIRAAMRETAESPRPDVAPTAELAALVDFLRAHAPATGRCVLLVEATDHSLRPQRDPDQPVGVFDGGWTTFRELAHLVERLRSAEAHPAHGSWFFLRLETTPDRYAVDRRYDSWPDWMSSDDGSSTLLLDALQREVDRRAPQFRPAWTPLLAPETAWRQVPAT